MTEKTRHTPGPWEAHWHDKWIIGDKKTFTHIAEVCIDSKMRAREMDENSRLIAAAPDLLEACETALDIILSYQHIPAQFRACQALQNAISKAKGGA